jgi:hypothetical protein
LRDSVLLFDRLFAEESSRFARQAAAPPPNYELTGRVQNSVQLAMLNGLLDRGLNYELDARFQTVDELIGRLNEIANPAAKLPVEDLDTVAAREAAALRKNDRKTQLSDYFANVQGLGQSTQQCVVDLNNRLSKHFNTFSVSLPRQIDRGAGKTDLGDLVAVMAIRLAVKNHKIIYEIKYSIAAQATECTLYREIDEIIPGTVIGQKTTRQIETKLAVTRYQGENEIDHALVVADIRETVTRAIPWLSHRIQNGY